MSITFTTATSRSVSYTHLDVYKRQITVNNGSLTTGGNGNVGIYYYWSGTNNAGTSSLTVSGNAVVDTRNSQIMAQNKETVVQVGAGSDGNGGIVFNGKSGTVYGDVTLQEDLEIGTDESLTIGKDASLTVPDGTTLTNNGTINVESGGKLEGTPTGNGTLKIAPAITTQPTSQTVTEGETATFNVEATGTDLTYQWQQKTDGGAWSDISGANSETYTIETTTMDMSGTQYRCVVENSIDEVTSDAATLTVQQAGVPIPPQPTDPTTPETTAPKMCIRDRPVDDRQRRDGGGVCGELPAQHSGISDVAAGGKPFSAGMAGRTQPPQDRGAAV